MSAIEIVEAREAAAREQAFLIRQLVFVEEQQVPAELEFDAMDAHAIHLLAVLDRRPVGTLRLRFPEAGVAKIERVAVLTEARGLAIGHRLMHAALQTAREHGARQALLHAQVRVRRFYERLGFEAFDGTFVEDGILHVAMRRALTPDGEDFPQ